MKPIVDIVDEIIQGMSLVDPIKSIVDNMDGTFTIEVCRTFHVREASIIDIGGTDYTVVSVVNNQSITVQAISSPVGESFTANVPFYIHGTKIAVETELNKIIDTDQKLPMIYLYETLREVRQFDNDSIIERVARLRFFILDSADFRNWLTDDHYQYSVQPMDNLAIELVNAFKKDNRIGKIQDYDITPRSRFGQVVENGNVKLIFSVYASGVQLELDLPVKRVLNCEC